MLNASDLLIAIKKTAVEAVQATKPTAIVFGKVVSAVPLKINVEQKLTLTSAQLVLTRNVTSFITQMTISNTKTPVTIHNSLIIGDLVVLAQVQGGQKYIVLDRVLV